MKAAIRSVPGSLTLMIFLSWVSADPVAYASDKYANIHSIGIVSAIGETLALGEWEGGLNLDFFGHPKPPIPIDDWRLDDRITQEVSTALSSRFTIKPVTYTRAEFAGIQQGFFFGWSEVSWEDHVKALSPAGVDAYVVLCPHVLYGVVAPSDIHLRGIGFYQGEVYAFYSVIVVDARSGKMIDSADGVLPRSDWGISLNYPPPIVATDLPPSAASSGALDPELKLEVKAIVERLIDNSINHALANLDLIDASLKLVPASPPAPTSAPPSQPAAKDLSAPNPSQ